MDWLSYANEFPTLVGLVASATIGFTGVIVALAVNAWLARKQQAKEASLTREIREEERDHERRTLRAALIAELRINRSAIESNLDKDMPDEDGAACVPTDLMNEAYQSFLPRIGLLSAEEVSKVMLAYLTLQSYTANLFLIGVPPQTTSRHVQVPGKNLKLLPGMHRQLLAPIDEALGALSENGVGGATL